MLHVSYWLLETCVEVKQRRFNCASTHVVSVEIIWWDKIFSCSNLLRKHWFFLAPYRLLEQVMDMSWVEWKPCVEVGMRLRVRPLPPWKRARSCPADARRNLRPSSLSNRFREHTMCKPTTSCYVTL